MTYKRYIQKFAWLLIVLNYVIQRSLPKLFPQPSMFREIFVRALLFAITFGIVYLISGRRVFSYFGKGTMGAFKALKAMIFPLFVLSVVLIVTYLHDGEHFAEGWQKQLLQYTVLFFFVGLMEEMSYRVLVNDALLTSFNNKKHIFVFVAVFSALFFGFVHVRGSSLDSAIKVLNALLKVSSAGLIGTLFLLTFWAKRNIFGCMLVHMLYDLLPSIPKCLFEDMRTLNVEYVLDGELGKVSLVVYAIQILWPLHLLKSLWKKEGKNIDFAALKKEYEVHS